MSDIDWKEVILGQKGEGIQVIEHLAERRFNSGPLAEESVNYVIENISKNNWKLCSGFKGNANAKTFARRIIINLLEEFSRKRFGRPRPPSWLQRQGETWVKLWKELCLERQLLPSLIDRYSSQGLYDKNWIQTVTTVIKARIPNCGQANLEATSTDDIISVSNQAIIEDLNNPLQEANFVHEEDRCGYDFELSAQAEIILVLQAIMKEPTPSALFEPSSIEHIEITTKNHNDIFKQLPQKIQLTDEEIILLRMVYRDGLTRTAVASAIGLNNYQVNVKLNAILNRIRTVIDDCGLCLETLLIKM